MHKRGIVNIIEPYAKQLQKDDHRSITLVTATYWPSNQYELNTVSRLYGISLLGYHASISKSVQPIHMVWYADEPYHPTT